LPYQRPSNIDAVPVPSNTIATRLERLNGRLSPKQLHRYRRTTPRGFLQQPTSTTAVRARLCRLPIHSRSGISSAATPSNTAIGRRKKRPRRPGAAVAWRLSGNRPICTRRGRHHLPTSGRCSNG